MRVSIQQEPSFADDIIKVPDTELDTMNQLIDWAEFEPYFYRIEGDYSGLSLFKVLLLQSWFALSDASISSALCRDLVFMRFCGFSIEGNKPNASTICRFRKRLVDSNKLNRLLKMLNEQLTQQHLKIANGKYVSCDATLISSSRRPRKCLEESTDVKKTGLLEHGSVESKENHLPTHQVSYSDDDDASWKNKGKQSVYGYAGYVTTDDEGFVEAVSTRTARDSEMTVFPEIIKEADITEGKTLLYDKGVTSTANQDVLKEHGLRDGIMRKKPKGKPMSHWNKQRNKLIGRRRFVVERTFGTLKRVYGLHRARYLGLEKVNAEILLKSMAYNLKRAYGVLLKNLKQPTQDSCVQLLGIT